MAQGRRNVTAANTDASKAPYYGWTQKEWSQYSSQYGNTGTPVYHKGRLVAVKNSSVDLDSTTSAFNSASNTQTNSNTGPDGNPTGATNPNANGSNEKPDGTNNPNNPQLKENKPKSNQPPTIEETIANVKERNKQRKDEIEQQKKNNSAFKSEAANIMSELGGTKDALEPNILSQVDSPTYNLKLILCNPAAEPLKAAAAGGGVVVAESGVTTQFNITDCRINQHVGNVQGRTDTFGSEVFLTIEEPYGFTLPERLVAACQGLGIENHLVAEYVLECRFKGTDPNTGGPSDALQQLVWRIPLVIAQMKMNVAATSKYDIVLYDTGDSANAVKGGVIKQDITVSGETLGEWFDNFTVQLNEQQEKQITPNDMPSGISIAHQYEFKLEGKHRAYKFSKLDPSFIDSNSKEGFQLDNKNKITCTIQKGTHIPAMVKMMFLATTEYQKRLEIQGDTGAVPTAPKDNDIKSAKTVTAQNLKNIVRIAGDVKVIKYDPKRNDYAKKFIYMPYEHTQLNTIMNAGEYLEARGSNAKAKATAKTRLGQLFSKKLLRKRYDHRFTGINTEVLNAEVNLDNLYFMATEIYAGVHNNAGNYKVGDRFNDYQEKGVREYNTTGELLKGGSSSPASNRVLSKLPGDIKYLEEVDYRLKQYAPFSNKTFEPDNIPNDAKFGPAGTPTGGDRKMGQVHYNLQTGDMLELTLNIKGDPYWLGASKKGRDGNSQTENDGNYAKYQEGSNSFVFVMRTPEGYDENTGQTRNMIEADTIAGIYMVVGVEHVFSNGMFTQTLIAYMEDTLSFGFIKTLV